MASSSKTGVPTFDAPELGQVKGTLVTACHILDREGITDGYGHVSVRCLPAIRSGDVRRSKSQAPSPRGATEAGRLRARLAECQRFGVTALSQGDSARVHRGQT